MIISNDKKLIVLLNPKTGTQALKSALDGLGPFDVIDGQHETLGMLETKPELKAISLVAPLRDYQVFAFYRDPVERFISAANHMRRGLPGVIRNLFYDRLKDVHLYAGTMITSAEQYQAIAQEYRDKLESISYLDILDVYQFLKKNFRLTTSDHKRMLAFFPQTTWLQSDQAQIQLCDFRNYSNEVNRIAAALGSGPVDSPTVNQSVKLPGDQDLNPDTRAKIMAEYQQDYDFFASKNITFT